MQAKPSIAQGKALIENALTLGIPINDLLTAEGAEVAWTPLQDFRVTLHGVLVEFRKGEPIREAYRIKELRGLGCPVASLEPELWRRVIMAQPAKATSDVISLKPGFMGLSHYRPVRCAESPWRLLMRKGFRQFVAGADLNSIRADRALSGRAKRIVTETRLGMEASAYTLDGLLSAAVFEKP